MHAYASANMEWIGGKGPDIRSLEKLAKVGATIIGVQEARIEHIRGFLKRNPDWDYAYVDLPEFRVVGVLYRKDLYSAKYEHVGVPIGNLGRVGAGEDFIKQKIVSAPLLTVRTGADAGKTFRVVNTHLVASAWRPWPANSAEGKRRRAAWHKQMTAFNKAATKGGVPTVGGGDVNGLLDKVKPYARNGWAWKTYTGKSHKLGQIDRTGSAGGVKQGAVRLIPLEGSDHNAVYTPFTLPAVKPKPPAKEPNMLPSNLPQILRDHGLKVVEVNDWENRKRPGLFAPVGVLCHHTATGPSTSNTATNNLLVRGRSDLPGPLCQLGLGRDGTVFVIARGRSNHGGKAKASGTVAAGDANRLYIGIEAFNDGRGEKWPAAQYDAYVRLAAVLCVKVTGNSAETVRGHKETSVTGKIDPTFSMPDFRKRVAAEIAGMRTTKPPKPAKDRTLKVTNPRMSGDDVRWVQSFFRIAQDGVYGVKTRAAIRRFQVRHGIEPVSGEVGPRTRKALRAIEKKK